MFFMKKVTIYFSISFFNYFYALHKNMQCFEFVDNKCLVLKKYLQYETCLFDHFYMQVRHL